MKHVIIINGKPKSGKTTFERECVDYINENEIANSFIMSSIDPIKEIYMKLGWDGVKTAKARKDLSVLKEMWSTNCNGPIHYIVKNIIDLPNHDDYVIFVDIREEAEIIRLRNILKALKILNIKCTTVFIDRSNDPKYQNIEYGNKSDDLVGKMMSIYDYVITNDKTVSKLYEKARKFIKDVVEEYE